MIEELILSSNAFSGTIPSELGNLPNLGYLAVDRNPMSGALPRSLMNLDNLSAFYYYDTNICEPPDAEFQAWLNSIPNRSGNGVICP